MGKEKINRPILAADGKIVGPTTADVQVQLGDAAGTYKFAIVDSATAEVASIDSDGGVTSVSITNSSDATISGSLSALGGQKDYVELTSTGSTTMSNYGVSVIGATSRTQDWTLDAPSSGVHKYVFALVGASSVAATIGTGTTDITFNAAEDTVIDFSTAGQFVHLVGYSTARWLWMSSTTLVFGSSST